MHSFHRKNDRSASRLAAPMRRREHGGDSKAETTVRAVLRVSHLGPRDFQGGERAGAAGAMPAWLLVFAPCQARCAPRSASGRLNECPHQSRGACVHRMARAQQRHARRRTRVVQGPERPSRMLQALGRGHPVLPMAGQERPLPDRARQRLRRQHLAHPDDQDRQGVRRPARGRRQARGVQGRLDRRGRRRADRRDRQLHQLRLRRDHHHRAEPDRLHAGDQARQ